MPSPCPVRGGPLGERREPGTRVCDLRFPFPCFLRSLSLSRGCRFSLFSAKAVHANAQLFCSLGARDRENRQPLDRERNLGRKRERIEKGGEVNQGVTVLPRRGNRSCLRASSVRTCRGGTEASDSSYRASWPPSR